MSVKFETGDVVYLKSGSPALTVVNPQAGSGFTAVPDVQVTWLDADGKTYNKMTLPAVCFTKEKPTAYTKKFD